MEGFAVVEEAATDVIALSQAKGIAEPWMQPGFLEAIVDLQQAREGRTASIDVGIQFHDRSVICTAALAEYLQISMPRTLVDALRRVREEHTFERQVFLLRGLGFVTRTEARRISYEEALHFEEIHVRTYRELGFEIVSIGPGTVPERVAEIKRALSIGCP
jgi:predicted ATPase